MESKKDYIARVFNDARALGICSKQKEFAELLGMNSSTLSNALNGNERYLSDSIIRRVQAWEQQVLDPRRGDRPAPARPDIVIPAATADLYNNMSETIRIQAEIIARLQAGGYSGLAPKNFATDRK